MNAYRCLTGKAPSQGGRVASPTLLNPPHPIGGRGKGEGGRSDRYHSIENRAIARQGGQGFDTSAQPAYLSLGRRAITSSLLSP